MELKEFSARKQESSSLSAYRERQGNRAMETGRAQCNTLPIWETCCKNLNVACNAWGAGRVNRGLHLASQLSCWAC
eukprot:scaffold41664_cov17-Tisochrysis_lutea.AAC.2